MLLTRDNVVLVGIVNGASPAPRGHIANGGIGASASEFAETVAAAADAK